MTGDDEGWLRVESALLLHWGLRVTKRERLSGGRNAATWRVTGPDGHAVAKLVDPADANLAVFESALLLAALLDRPDLPTAPPLPAFDGRVVVAVGSQRLALLPWLAGRPLSATTDSDLDRLGAALAALHGQMTQVSVPADVPAWPWSWLSLDALGLEPFDVADRRLVERAVRAATGPYRLGVVHGDPSPDNFIAVGAVVGVIDWATVMHGPLSYDLAVLALSAERAGARPSQVSRLLASYGAAAPDASHDTCELMTMRALRLAAEVVYFTSRMRQPVAATFYDDMAGLARSRAALRALGCTACSLGWLL